MWTATRVKGVVPTWSYLTVIADTYSPQYSMWPALFPMVTAQETLKQIFFVNAVAITKQYMLHLWCSNRTKRVSLEMLSGLKRFVSLWLGITKIYKWPIATDRRAYDRSQCPWGHPYHPCRTGLSFGRRPYPLGTGTSPSTIKYHYCQAHLKYAIRRISRNLEI